MTWLLRLLFMVQVLLGLRVLGRLARTARGEKVPTLPRSCLDPESVTVLLPVLNESTRIKPCLESLSRIGCDVDRIIVIDGGSTDGTQAIVSGLAERDARITLIEMNDRVPAGENGKAHQIEAGRRHAGRTRGWVLTIDADVRIDPRLVPSMLRFANRNRLAMLSVATQQQVSGAGSGLLHPSFLTTLVYRMGIPGQVTTRVEEAQANGQCCLIDVETLDRIGGFAAVVDSLCEDVTLARLVARAGQSVGFTETEGLAKVEMYADWRELWRNWPRSLVLRDRLTKRSWLLGVGEVLAIQALPLPVLALGVRSGAQGHPLVRLNLGLLMARIGVLAGTRRAYLDPPRSYWLSPLADLPAAIALLSAGLRRRHTWRGRVIERGGT